MNVPYVTDHRTHLELQIILGRIEVILDRLEAIVVQLNGEDAVQAAIRQQLTKAEASLSQKMTDLGDSLMSALSDKIKAVGDATDAAATRVQGDVAVLKQEIATLQATVDAGGATQADLDALDALKAKVDAIDPSTPSVLPTPEPAPPA
jgi:chromosome segregation ATPase